MLRFFIVVLFYIGASASAVSAGLVSKFVDGPIVDKAKLADGENAVKAAVNTATKAGKSAAGVGLAEQNAAIKNLSFAQDLGRNLRAAALTTGVTTAISGGKLGRNALSGLGSATVNTVSANLAHQIGERYANGSGDMSWLTHKLCHFVLGGTAAELTGGVFLAGGTGATVGEMVADAMIQRALEQTRADVREQLEDFRNTYGELPPLQEAEALVQLTYLEAEQAEQIQRIGRLAAAGTALIGRMDINIADAAADLAIEYNSICSQIASLTNWIGERYRKVQVWLDEHTVISFFVPGSLWTELEGKIHRNEKLTTLDLAAAGMSFIPLGGNASGKGLKAVAIANKGVQKTVVVNGCKRTWQQLSKAEKTVYQNNYLSKMLKEKKWVDSKHKIRGEKAYYCKETKLYYTKVKGEKCDFEAWHVTGKKAEHKGAIECIDGNMYEIGPKHPISPFD